MSPSSSSSEYCPAADAPGWAGRSGESASRSIAVVGAGPRAVGWLERIAANQRQLPAGRLTIHFIDPYPAGGGRIWRSDQSPLLKLNSMARDVTMFTDVSSTIDGPIVEGPALDAWAAGVKTGDITDVVIADPALRQEIDQLVAGSFPTRRLQSVYLDWFFRRAVAGLPGDIDVVVHDACVVGTEDLDDGTQRAELDSGEHVEADLLLYAVGHNGSTSVREHRELSRFAADNDLFYLPPAFTADADLTGIAAGETVIVRGFGLAAIDLIVLLTGGRGGRFGHDDQGRLRYIASGREPRIAIGSRRGIPYHSKISSTLAGDRPEAVYFNAQIAESLVSSGRILDFRADVWPLIAKEMLNGYYAELFTGHPERVRVDWSDFSVRFSPLDPFGDELETLVGETVIDPADRLDLERFDRPLDGIRYADADELQEAVRAYVREDLDRRTAPEHSATLGLFTSLLFALFALAGVADAPAWSARSRERDLHGWWPGYFSYIASGPPGHRLEELLALSEAGIVDFIGADIRIESDSGCFAARGANTDRVIRARALVDAWLPRASAAQSDNPALRHLVQTGSGFEHVVTDDDHSTNTGLLSVRAEDARLILADGAHHPRRYAIGPFTTSPFVGAFARPGTNAVSFRENDRVARAMLRHIRDLNRHPQYETAQFA